MHSPAVPRMIVSRNPATGAELAQIESDSPDLVARLVESMREGVGFTRLGHQRWSHLDPLRNWYRVLITRAEELADAVSSEIGKPRVEAMATEILPTLDMLQWTIRNAHRAFATQRVGTWWQRPIRGDARITWQSHGLIGILGAWNYPILLNAPLIASAIAAGNSVVWKPSEFSAFTGQLLQDTIKQAGLHDRVRIVQGGPEVGRALAESNVAKIWFTGGITGGRAVLEAAARRGASVVAELSGFDPAIVLPDAPLKPTADALCWSAFVGCGQTCTSVKRIYVLGDARPLAEEIASRASALRVGDPSRGATDMGPMISEDARSRFHQQISAAIASGATLLHGGQSIPGPGWFYLPTVLLATDDRPERDLVGCFGPVVIVRGVRDEAHAIAAANDCPYALTASVWGRDRRKLNTIAQQLDAPAVGINEAVTFFAHPSAPIGGRKASGHGRVHGIEGLREFATPTAIVTRRFRALRPQLFPYSNRFASLIDKYRRLIHG
jgi:succinate-semialdehyde dehydrogenase / glutarate-semialdehyde dehydrogenase